MRSPRAVGPPPTPFPTAAPMRLMSTPSARWLAPCHGAHVLDEAVGCTRCICGTTRVCDLGMYLIHQRRNVLPSVTFLLHNIRCEKPSHERQLLFVGRTVTGERTAIAGFTVRTYSRYVEFVVFKLREPCHIVASHASESYTQHTHASKDN
jgi:hypothetical protein